jgi:hypothetical protein
MRELENAIRQVETLLKLLVISMKDRGWQRASAELRISHRGAPALRLQACDAGDGAPFHTHYSTWNWEMIEAATLEEALHQAQLVIATMDEHPTRAMAPWFTLSQSGEAPLPLAASLEGSDGNNPSSVAAASSPPRRDGAAEGDGGDGLPNEAVVVCFPQRVP